METPSENEAAPDERMTADEFYRRYVGKDFELVDGRVVAMPPVNPTHGDLDTTLVLRLGAYVREHGLGRHYLNTGFVLRDDPPLVRAPDQAFVSNARIQSAPPPAEGFWRVAPDLAVEIVSPGDSAEAIAEKTGDYLTSGVRLVWIIYPRKREAHAFHPSGEARVVKPSEVLDGEDVVPGFKLPLNELFAA